MLTLQGLGCGVPSSSYLLKLAIFMTALPLLHMSPWESLLRSLARVVLG